MEREADITVDLQGTLSALSLLKVSRLFREMRSDQILEVRGCDASQRRDLVKLLPDAAFDFDADISQGDEQQRFRVRLKKTP